MTTQSVHNRNVSPLKKIDVPTRPDGPKKTRPPVRGRYEVTSKKSYGPKSKTLDRNPEGERVRENICVYKTLT